MYLPTPCTAFNCDLELESSRLLLVDEKSQNGVLVVTMFLMVMTMINTEVTDSYLQYFQAMGQEMVMMVVMNTEVTDSYLQ